MEYRDLTKTNEATLEDILTTEEVESEGIRWTIALTGGIMAPINNRGIRND